MGCLSQQHLLIAIKEFKGKSSNINILLHITHLRGFQLPPHCETGRLFEPKRFRWILLFFLCLCQRVFPSDGFTAGDRPLWLPSV